MMSIMEMTMASLFPRELTANANNEDDPKHSIEWGFLMLPAEIRNMIYRLLLTSPFIPMLRSLTARNRLSHTVCPPLPLCANLISTCKQIREEARSILYSENTFVAHDTLLTGLPYLINPQRPILAPGIGRIITKWYIHVRLDCDPRYTEQSLKESFNGCDSLEVEVSQSMYRSAEYTNLLLFAGIRGVKRARVHGSVEPDFAKWLEDCMRSPLGTECGEFGKVMKNLNGYSVWVDGAR